MMIAGAKIRLAALFSVLLLQFIYNPSVAEGKSLSQNREPEAIFSEYMRPELWQHFRLGLAYLESPKPLDAPEAVSPSYLHPDSKGHGPYGFTRGAYLDVQRLYPSFKKYSWQDILASQKLYDLANQAYADWLLGNLQEYLKYGALDSCAFNILQQAWNLGLSGFKSGKKICSSRRKRAREYMEYSNRLQVLTARKSAVPAALAPARL